jgi:predicted ribosomally synthesized peptide with SipW-like signal peptide
MSKLDLARRLRSTRSRALLSLGVVVALSASGTFALWNDSVVVTGTTISTGSIDIVVNADTDDVVNFATMNVSALLPGQTTAGMITVNNAGLSPLTYYATQTITGTTFPAATLTVKMTNAAATSPAGGGLGATCGGTTYSTGVAGGFVTGDFIGSLATQRPLAVGATENFCVQATLSLTADQTLYSAKTTNVALTFTATQ